MCFFFVCTSLNTVVPLTTGVASIGITWGRPPAESYEDDDFCPPCFDAATRLVFDGDPLLELNQNGSYKLFFSWLSFALPSREDWAGLKRDGPPEYEWALTGDDAGTTSNVTLDAQDGTLIVDYTSDYNVGFGLRHFLVWAHIEVVADEGYPAKRQNADFEHVPKGNFILSPPAKITFRLPAHQATGGTAATGPDDVEGAGDRVEEVNAVARLASQENVRPGFEGVAADAAIEVGQLSVDMLGMYEYDPSLTPLENNTAYQGRARLLITALFLLGILALGAISGSGSVKSAGGFMTPIGGAVFAMVVTCGWLLGWLWLDLYGWAPTFGMLAVFYIITSVVIVGRYRSGL